MLELNKLYVMDVLDGLSHLPNESAQIIIADPPYNIGKDFGNNTDIRALDEYVSWSDKWLKECIRILKPNGTMFVYGFSEILAHLSVRIPLKKRWLIWHYTNKNIPSIHFWQRSHESIICCWKDDKVFNEDDVREPYTDGFLNGAAGKKRAGTVGRLSKHGKETVYNAHPKGALPRDVIKIPALAGGAGMSERWFICRTCNNKICKPEELRSHVGHNIEKHPTQKPLALCERLIKSARQDDGFVLIPFVGSGSECVAAKRLNLDYIGFDLNPDYIRLAEERLRNEKRQITLI